MGLVGNAAIAGIADWKPERQHAGEPRFTIEQYAELARLALEDAQIEAREVDGLVTARIGESSNFMPATTWPRTSGKLSPGSGSVTP